MAVDALPFAAGRLLDARAARARSRSATRALLSAMEAEAERQLGALFTGDDPVTGRPVCMLVMSADRLGDEYENQTPRPIPDSVSRLTVEILGRLLTIDIDDFGRVTVDGVDGAERLHRVERSAEGTVFVEDPRDAGVPPATTFGSLLARLIEAVVADEESARRI